MSELPRPIGRVLRQLPPAVIERAWPLVRDRNLQARAQRVRLMWLGAAATVLAIVVSMLTLSRSPTGPLRLKSGNLPTHFEETTASPQTAMFDDGSSISLDRGARLSVLENTSASFAMLLSNGRVEIEVHPGGPRRWSIECGPARVDVVGTHFVVVREGERARVIVSRGTVLVRSDLLAPDHVKRLEAGDEIVVEKPEVQTPPAALASAPRPVNSATEAIVTIPRPKAWRELATAKDFAGAYTSLGHAGLAAEAQSASVDDLFVLADVARLSGHSADAALPLRRIVTDHPGDGRGSLAAFTLAKLELDSLGRASDAADDFARALRLGLPSALREDAQARGVEALSRAGRRDEAAHAAEAFFQAFPSSPRQSEVQRWVAPAPLASSLSRLRCRCPSWSRERHLRAYAMSPFNRLDARPRWSTKRCSLPHWTWS